MLQKAMAAVRAFHVAFNQPAPTAPTPQPLDAAQKRAAWIKSEADELVDDTVGTQMDETQDVIDMITVQADAYIDGIYFNLGGLVELGLDPDPLFEIVQNANMAKLHLIDGVLQPVKVEGKVVKPEGWQDPHPLLRAEVERQVMAARDGNG